MGEHLYILYTECSSLYVEFDLHLFWLLGVPFCFFLSFVLFFGLRASCGVPGRPELQSQ